jgi:hypothetical protein
MQVITSEQFWTISSKALQKTTEKIKNKLNLLILIIGFYRKNINIMQRRCQTDYVTNNHSPFKRK